MDHKAVMGPCYRYVAQLGDIELVALINSLEINMKFFPEFT